MELQLQVEGLNEALHKLKKAPRILKKARRRMLGRMANLLQAKVSRYRLGNVYGDYTRTGLLGRSWISGVEGSGLNIRGFVENPTKYAPYVVGDDEAQAWMHKGRWFTVGRRARRLMGHFLKIGDEEVARAVKEIDK